MKEFKKPDVKAPRYRLCPLKLIDDEFIKNFKLKYPKYNDLTNLQIREIINCYNINLWKGAINNRDGVEFPEGLGYIFIGTCPSPIKVNVDYNKSLKLNTRVKHRNFESDNYLCKIFYTNYANKYKFKNRELWSFKGTRQFTRSVSKVYPLEWKRFVQIDNFTRIKDLYKKFLKRDWINKRNSVIHGDYNEFLMD